MTNLTQQIEHFTHLDPQQKLIAEELVVSTEVAISLGARVESLVEVFEATSEWLKNLSQSKTTQNYS